LIMIMILLVYAFFYADGHSQSRARTS
jgi:hypothetical protein